MDKKKVLVLFAHPVKEKSKINRKLIEAINDLENVKIHYLYESYPDFQIDVKREQQLLIEHDIIIWQHPFYWYSAPAIVKEWMDLVLEHNFAYGKDGNALSGKYALTTITTGGSKSAYCENGYSHFTINQFLAPFQQSASLCKMKYLPPFVVHGTHLLSDPEILNYASDYKRTLISLRDNLFDDTEILNLEYLNELIV